MELHKAQELAIEIKDILKLYCLQIEIAGSIRRKKPDVKDIELVVVADKYKLEKYFIDNKKLYEFKKNGGKYKQFYFKWLNVDLFIADEDNFGLIYLIRTGSAEFSTKMLAQWKRVTKGGESRNGYLHTADGEKIITRTEEEVFKLCEMDFIDPELRN